MILLDIIPTIEHFERANMEFVMDYYYWFWLAHINPVLEYIIKKAPEEWLFAHTTREKKKKNFFSPNALHNYLKCVKNPVTISAICKEYETAASIDLIDHKISREDKLPITVLWRKRIRSKIGQ